MKYYIINTMDGKSHFVFGKLSYDLDFYGFLDSEDTITAIFNRSAVVSIVETSEAMYNSYRTDLKKE